MSATFQLTDPQRTLIARLLAAEKDQETHGIFKFGASQRVKVAAPRLAAPGSTLTTIGELEHLGFHWPPSLPSQEVMTAPQQDFGTDVSGWSQLVLFQDGAYNFTGQFNNSSPFSGYNDSFVWGVIGESRILYTFAHQGHLDPRSPFGGSTTDPWSLSGSNPAMKDDWAGLTDNFTWHWVAAANYDFGTLLKQLEALAAVGGIVTAVIAIV